ncbi:hypothetical protein [Maricaulis sp.]|uniref:hypothetical protein n=1 Tax=Maricaulis sp. TaxID=1486257 RepID=UPI003A9458F7
MSLKGEAITAGAALAVAITLAVFSVNVTDKLRAGGHWPSAAPVVAPPEAAAPDPIVDHTPLITPAQASMFETVLDDELSFGTPILPVFAACQGHMGLLDGDAEFRHSRVEGVDWLEYYESAVLPDGGLAIRGFRAPMATLTAAADGGILVVTTSASGFVAGAWHVNAMGEIDDAIELEAASGLGMPACLDPHAAAAALNPVLAGDHSGIGARRSD